MKTFQKVSLVFVALLLAFQFTLGVSEAKTQPKVIPVKGSADGPAVILQAQFTPLSDGYVMMNGLALQAYKSNHDELTTGLNHVTITFVGKADTILTDHILWGTSQFVVPYYTTPSGWNSTYTGYSYSVKNDPKVATIVEVFVSAKGYGELEGYTWINHNTIITYKSGVVDETFMGKVYPPQ